MRRYTEESAYHFFRKTLGSPSGGAGERSGKGSRKAVRLFGKRRSDEALQTVA